MFLFTALLLGSLCVLQLDAQDPIDLLRADRNFINRYNSWEYPYYFLPGRYGRQTVKEEMERKSLPIIHVPVTLSNPIVSLINRANTFYRMVRGDPMALDPRSPYKGSIDA